MSEMLIPISGGNTTGSEDLTARAADVLKGKTAITADSDDEAIAGTLEVQSIVNFRVAQSASSTVLVTWQLPAKGPYSGVIVKAKNGAWPSSATDGVTWYEGAGTSFSKMVSVGTWYLRAFSYLTTNYGRMYADGYLQASITTSVIHGSQTFKTSGTFTVPGGVTSVTIFAVGGGGGGAHGFSGGRYGAGGGAGGYTNTGTFTVTPGATHQVVIGAGGAAGYGADSSNGGDSYVYGLITAAGGKTGKQGDKSVGGPGGIGGSGGGRGSNGSATPGYPGGSDGANSRGSSGSVVGGKGQGTTTREFGDANGTLYAGGGGGGGYYYQTDGGAGGDGGGGRGANGTDENAVGANGTPNTGGGGGGGHGPGMLWQGSAGNGGSGIVIIKW